MPDVWYCSQCGYEVYKGGKCHNCREPLTASPLAELAEGEAAEEVGYSLDGWQDAARGDLIAVLVDRSVRHRFEGDELVVMAVDEDKVDTVIAELGAADEEEDEEPEEAGPGQSAEVALGVLARLYDAAQRLRADPTDMVADGDLAEAAGRMFAIERMAGVDDEAWAAIGRVTRRLLGALGAEEALEKEISESAELLCRLVEELDLSGRAAPASAEDSEPGYARISVPAPIEVGSSAATATAAPAEPGVVELSAPSPAEDDEMVFELDDWMPEERAQISLLLDRNQITHEWEGTDLIVAAADDERVEALMGNVERSLSTDSSASEEADDEARYHVLSNLFGAADRLIGDPENEQKQADVTDAAKLITEWATPFAMTDDDWWKIKLRAKTLTDAIELGAVGAMIQDQSTSLRDLLRAFV